MYAGNRTRFANAPVMSAGVMMANIIWYAKNTNSGIVSLAGAGVLSDTPRRNARSKLPTIPAKSVPLLRSPLKHIENPKAHQSTVVHPIDAKLCIMIASTFFRPTSPP